MTWVMGTALALLLGATHEVAAGEPLSPAIAAARPGDTIRLGPGVHRGTLGRLDDITVEGAGADRTSVLAPEGEEGASVVGAARLSGLALRAGAARCALRVLGGAATLDDVALSGGRCGAFVDGGRLDGREVQLAGDYGLLAKHGAVSLRGGTARGGAAGVALLSGTLALTRFAVTGPAREAGITISGGSATLADVVIRSPGPTGLAASGRGSVVEASDVVISGTTEVDGFLGACVQVQRATVRLESSLLVKCGGTAVEAAGGEIRLAGVDAAGGEAGGLVLLDGARAELVGNRITGHGPALVVASGSRASVRMNTWRAAPAFWVECGSGARVELGPGEHLQRPCSPAPGKGADPLDKSAHP